MDMQQPLISVITPVYRSEEILARAVGSLLAQDFPDWEAVIVDDGSPDPSWRVVQAYSWIDPRIRTIHQAHAGACITRNRGIAEARGDYLLFLDADDWMESDALSALHGACEKNGWIAAHGSLRYVTPEGHPTSWEGGYKGDPDLFDAISCSNVLSVPSAALVRRSVLNEIGTFDPSLVHCGDWDLWARLARHDGTIGRVDQTVTNYRMRPGSLSRSPRTLLRDAMTTLRRIHAPDARVLNSKPRLAQGADMMELASRICYFAVYAAGLAVSGGRYEPAEAVLEMVPRWTELDPQRAAEFIFYAVCFAHCCGPEGVSQFWPDIVEPLHHLLAEIERLSRTRGLAGRMIEAMDGYSEERLSTLPQRMPEPAKVTPQGAEVFSTAYETFAHDALRSLAEQHNSYDEGSHHGL
jgi:glycosyltransferase involved in cell wall biosynthesis